MGNRFGGSDNAIVYFTFKPNMFLEPTSFALLIFVLKFIMHNFLFNEF